MHISPYSVYVICTSTRRFRELGSGDNDGRVDTVRVPYSTGTRTSMGDTGSTSKSPCTRVPYGTSINHATGSRNYEYIGYVN